MSCNLCQCFWGYDHPPVLNLDSGNLVCSVNVSGSNSLDLTRLHQLLTEMPKETGTGAAEDLGMAQGQVQ